MPRLGAHRAGQHNPEVDIPSPDPCSRPAASDPGYTLNCEEPVNEREVSALLSREEDERLRQLSQGLPPLPAEWHHGEPLRVGERVVFTGCEDAGRVDLEKRTIEFGLRVTGSVSRRTAVLVSDGTVDGIKMRAARELGTRVISPRNYVVLLRHRQPALVAVANPPTNVPVPDPSTESAPALAEPAHTRAARSTPSETRPASPATVRSWAMQNGYDVGVRGRIRAEVWQAYEAASVAEGAEIPL
ncbi:Lsr2 family DNA-binding protein [Salana multivorans]